MPQHVDKGADILQRERDPINMSGDLQQMLTIPSDQEGNVMRWARATWSPGMHHTTCSMWAGATDLPADAGDIAIWALSSAKWNIESIQRAKLTTVEYILVTVKVPGSICTRQSN
jgi:hypothetical protein